jgi:hypothetical protein
MSYPKKDIRRAQVLSRKKKLTEAEQIELDKLLLEHRKDYIYGVYRDDVQEYADGATYTERERAELAKYDEEE